MATGYAPNYAWVGAPTEFNGTNTLTGGDSGMHGYFSELLS